MSKLSEAPIVKRSSGPSSETVEPWTSEPVDTQTTQSIKHLHECVPMFLGTVEEFLDVLLLREIQKKFKQ